MSNIQLYKHQKQALELTEGRNKVAYYLDMGLGKTFVGSEKAMNLGIDILLVCQKSKIDDWKHHFFEYYIDKLKCDESGAWCYDLTGSSGMDMFLHSRYKIKIGIINYELAWRRPELLNLKDFTLMLDESSQIKDETAKKSRFILKLKAKNNILLSGTPVSGKYEELWSQCRLLGWDISKRLFYDQFIILKKLDIGDYSVPIVVGYKNTDRLKSKLREHGAVFKKSDEVFDLPKQVEQVIKVANTKEYKRFKKDRLVEVEGKRLIGDMTLNRMLYERMLASQYNTAKLKALEDLINSTNDRLIIFYNFNEELERIKRLVGDRAISEINGRCKDLKAYENEQSSITLIQYTAGSMGLNLQKANKIVYFSLPLSSELMEQSKKRIHRIGQYQTCFYYYLITDKSIDEKIMNVLKERKDYTNKLFEEEMYEK